jgi:hypothetical protein
VKRIDKKNAVRGLDPVQVEWLLHPSFEPGAQVVVMGEGVAAWRGEWANAVSPGAPRSTSTRGRR